MSKTQLFRVLAIAGVAAAATPDSALAARPTFHDRFRDTIPDVELCGSVGTLEINGSQVITVTDSTFSTKGQVTQVLTTADGGSVTIQAAGTYTGTFEQSGDVLT